MEKVIEIDLICNDDLYEKYNRKIVSNDLVNYIITSAYNTKKKDKIKIIINNSIGISSVSLIKEGLKKEYEKSYLIYYKNNIVQIIYLLIGIIALFVSSIMDGNIFKEIILIGGWVLIWEMIELEIFSDVKEKRKRIILKKILNSEFIENNITK